MKTLKHWALSLWAFAGIMAIIVCGFVFTGCSDGSNEVTAVKDTVTAVTLDKDEIVLTVGATEQLTATVAPSSVSTADKTVTWKSNNTSVATVANGTVTAVADGIAVITVTTQKDSKTAACLVIVNSAPGAVAAVTLDKEELFMLVGGNTKTLTATVLPRNAINQNVSWLSSDPGVATVVNGEVTAVAIGNAFIIVTTNNGKTAACEVAVRTLPEIEGMVWIEPGTFMMGSPLTEPQSWEAEIPHQVTLTQGFYIGKYEVTQGQYKAVMGYNPSWFNNEGYEDDWENYPVDYVNWYDAVEFCNKLSEMQGLTPAYTIDGTDVEIDWDASGYRLPTEAEWEYACRAGTTGPFNFQDYEWELRYNYWDEEIWYPLEPTGQWGSDYAWNDWANFFGYYDYNGRPTSEDGGSWYVYSFPVGSYEPNAWGLYDMHGNLAEWCWDWYGSYRDTATGETEIDPKGAEYDPWYHYEKVVRGGSMYDPAEYIRSAYRSNYDDPEEPEFNYPMTIGFRVVLPFGTTPSGLAIKAPLNKRSAKMQMQEQRILPEGVRVLEKNSASPVRNEAVRRKGE
jgi:formylglycine-generating enzyme required for sulfatase activity